MKFRVLDSECRASVVDLGFGDSRFLFWTCLGRKAWFLEVLVGASWKIPTIESRPSLNLSSCCVLAVLVLCGCCMHARASDCHLR